MIIDAIQYILGKAGGLPLPNRPMLPYLVGEASSSVAWNTINDVKVAELNAVASPVKEFVADVDIIQSGSGTPSENNIRPFVGFNSMRIIRQRKNLVHSLRPAGRFTATTFYADINSDGSFTLTHRDSSVTAVRTLPLNPTTNYDSTDTEALYALPDLFVMKAGVTYIIQDCTPSCFTGDVTTRVNLYGYTAQLDAHRRFTFTPSVDHHVKQVRTYVSSTTEYDGEFTYLPMITTAEDLSWEAWQDGETYSTSLAAVGSSYGGEVSILRDGEISFDWIIAQGTVEVYQVYNTKVIGMLIPSNLEGRSISKVKSNYFSNDIPTGENWRCSITDNVIYFILPREYAPNATAEEISAWIAENNAVFLVKVNTAITKQATMEQPLAGMRTTHFFGLLTGVENWTLSTASGYRRFYTSITKRTSYPDLNWESYKDGTDSLSSHFEFSRDTSSNWGAFYISDNNYLVFLDNGKNFANSTELRAWIAEQYSNGTPLQFLYELDTPQTYQLQPADIKTVFGYNQIIANTGDIDIITYKESLRPLSLGSGMSNNNGNTPNLGNSLGSFFLGNGLAEEGSLPDDAE